MNAVCMCAVTSETASWEVIIWRTESQTDSYRPKDYVSELWSILWPLIHYKHANVKEESFSTGLSLHFISEWVAEHQAWRAIVPVCLSENVFLSSCVLT